MALISDRYHGAVAEGYEAHRRDRPPWAAEYDAVHDYVVNGPVLDAPIGTGRFVEIYKEKHVRYAGVDLSADMLAQVIKKDPNADVRVCDVRNLPFLDDTFETVVCSRLLNWLEPPDMILVIKELSRVAHHLIVSIRTGKEGLAGNYTHSFEAFCDAICHLYIEQSRVLQEVPGGIFEMFSLRRPIVTVKSVFLQFGVEENGLSSVIRLARAWTDHLNLEPLDWSKVRVTTTHVTNVRLKAILDQMAQDAVVGGKVTQIFTDTPPRRMKGPLTFLRVGKRDIILDGRRRANIWKDRQGSYLVLVVEAG